MSILMREQILKINVIAFIKKVRKRWRKFILNSAIKINSIEWRNFI